MNKVLIAIVLITCCQLRITGQVSTDSIDRLNSLAWDYSETDIIKAIEAANISKKLNSDKAYLKGFVENELIYGVIAYLTGDLEKALQKTNSALKYNSDPNIQSKIHNQLGRIFTDLDEYEKAEKNLHLAISINKKYRSRNQIQGNFINLGNLKSRTFDIDSAFYFFNEALNIAKKEKDTAGLITIYNNLGALNGAINELNLERTFYLKAYNLSGQSNIQKSYLAFNIANSYFLENELLNSEKYLKTALEESKKSKSLRGLENAYNLYGRIEKKKKNYKKSLEYYLLYFDVHKQLMNENIVKKTTKLQLESEFSSQLQLDSIQKVKEIAIIQQENIRKELHQKEKLKRTSIILAFSVAVLLLMGYILYRINRINVERKKANKIISLQKIEVEKQKELIEEKQNDIVASITYAKRLQNAILPSDSDIKTILPESFILYLPKDIIAGDFYWVEQKGDWTYFAVADCTGHGVPGAMVSVVCANALNSCINEYGIVVPGEILDKTTDLILEAFKKGEDLIQDGMDIALCSYNKATKELLFAGANNSLIVVSKHENKENYSRLKTIRTDDLFLHELKGNKQPVAYYENRKDFETISISVTEGDELFMYTDGFPDQFGGQFNKKYKSKNLKELILQQYQLPVNQQKRAILAAFESWKGLEEQIDDVCLLGFKI